MVVDAYFFGEICYFGLSTILSEHKITLASLSCFSLEIMDRILIYFSAIHWFTYYFDGLVLSLFSFSMKDPRLESNIDFTRELTSKSGDWDEKWGVFFGASAREIEFSTFNLTKTASSKETLLIW